MLVHAVAPAGSLSIVLKDAISRSITQESGVATMLASTSLRRSRPRAALAALIGASSLLLSPNALAATQGSLGATSTGSVTITASVPNRAQLTALSDVSFSSVDPSTAATNSQNVCAWSNTATKGYSITATGSGTGGAFTLASGVLSPVPYSIQWNQTSGQSSGTSLTAGTALGSLVSTATKPTCSSGPSTTASLIVTVAATDLQSMVAATSYTGTLTLLLTPQ